MKGLKKALSIIALIVLIGTDFLNPISYAIEQEEVIFGVEENVVLENEKEGENVDEINDEDVEEKEEEEEESEEMDEAEELVEEVDETVEDEDELSGEDNVEEEDSDFFYIEEENEENDAEGGNSDEIDLSDDELKLDDENIEEANLVEVQDEDKNLSGFEEEDDGEKDQKAQRELDKIDEVLEKGNKVDSKGEFIELKSLNNVLTKDGEGLALLDGEILIKGASGSAEKDEPIQIRGVSGEGIMDQMPDFYFTEIIISRPESISVGPSSYIIMDRNLGASTSGTSTDSYGYMYQWGNNYGFPSTGTSLPSGQVVSKRDVNVNLTQYGPVYDGKTQYYSGVFIKVPTDLTASERYDWATTVNDNIWGHTTDKDEARQGPCPNGWHVPSADDWNGAMAYWEAGSGNGNLNNFINHLKLPKAGSRARSSADLQKSGEGWYYTSTSTGKVAYALTFKTGAPSITAPNNRVDALSVRCFKDGITCESDEHLDWDECVSNTMTGFCMTGAEVENGYYTGLDTEINIIWSGNKWYVPMCEIMCNDGYILLDNQCLVPENYIITFELNGGLWYDGYTGDRTKTVEAGSDISEARPIKDPYKNGYMFMGWFDESSNSAYRFKFQGTTITGDLTLTARWATFNDIVYTGIIDGNERMIVLMDRNMGATATGSLRGASQNSYGFYYQWGNNYGFYFDPGKNINTQSQVGAKVDASGYGPNMVSGWYYGETFIKVDKTDYRDWSYVTNDNLWGGGGDNATNGYDNRTSGRYTRQGPCPKGYHVPSLGEWRDLVRLFYNNNGLGELTQTWPDYVGTAGGSTNASMRDEPISLTNRDDFANTFFIPAAGRVQYSYVWERYGNIDSKPRAPVWASSVINGNGALGFEVKFEGGYINIGGWNDERSQLKPVRCFKDMQDYTVTWKNYDGEVLETDSYVYEGATPSFDEPTNPTREGYEFTGWYIEGDETQAKVDLSEESVNSNRAYVAKFVLNEVVDYYTITFNDYDGRQLSTSGYHYGDNVVEPEHPTRESDGMYEYEFAGWTPATGTVTQSQVYTATYNSTYIDYTITWKNEDGSVIDTTTVEYGVVPTHADANQPADAQYTYEFIGWTPTPIAATGDASYRATYKHIKNKYTITWFNEDGSLIDTTEVEYGEVPTHSNPAKPADDEYIYNFAGWIPEVLAVTGAQTYTATYFTEKKEEHSESGGMSGGGGRGGNVDSEDSQHGSAEENLNGNEYTGDEVDDFNKDVVPLYKRSYENKITTIDTLKEADPDGLVTRGHLAKMVVNYMVNVLGRKVPYDVTYNCLYRGDNESSWESDEIRDYATKACAFGVMGINMENNEFLPNNIVTRAEFGTVMSRVLWGDKYDIIDTDSKMYYEDHLQALKRDDILTQINDSEARWEIRKWVWLVFRRITEKKK